MVQICYQPRVLLALSHVGETDEMRVQDASAFAACREELSYWELMVRLSWQAPLTPSMQMEGCLHLAPSAWRRPV